MISGIGRGSACGSALDERGITLMEVVVVGVLATIVMLALTGFYINSQGTWMDASGQAITQREGTLLMQALSDSIHASASGSVSGGVLTLRNIAGVERCHFWLESSDSLIHVGNPGVSLDQGPLARSTVTQFDVSVNPAINMVLINALDLRSPERRVLHFSTGATYYNR